MRVTTLAMALHVMLCPPVVTKAHAVTRDFDRNEFRVEGSNVLPQDQVE